MDVSQEIVFIRSQILPLITFRLLCIEARCFLDTSGQFTCTDNTDGCRLVMKEYCTHRPVETSMILNEHVNISVCVCVCT